MVFQLYVFASLIVFALAIGPFVNDPSQAKYRPSSWVFLALAMALSPITLPNMIKKWMSAQRSSTYAHRLSSKF